MGLGEPDLRGWWGPSQRRVWAGDSGGCCQTDANSSLFSPDSPFSTGAERPPLGESGGAGLLVGVAA